jgi:hypothetical protein
MALRNDNANTYRYTQHTTKEHVSDVCVVTSALKRQPEKIPRLLCRSVHQRRPRRRPAR